MAIQFYDDGSPTGHATIAADRRDRRQEEVCTYYDSHREYEKEEFKFVIKTVRVLAPGVLCAAKHEHTGGPFGGQRADLSWGKLGKPDENGDQKVSPWICRLICFGKNKGGKQFPPGPSFTSPWEAHLLSFKRRIAFPISLYNDTKPLPVWVQGQIFEKLEIADKQLERPPEAFAPYFCEDKWNSSEAFAVFLKQWLDQDALAKAVAKAQPPNGTA